MGHLVYIFFLGQTIYHTDVQNLIICITLNMIFVGPRADLEIKCGGVVWFHKIYQVEDTARHTINFIKPYRNPVYKCTRPR